MIHLDLGNLYLGLGRRDEAMEQYGKALETEGRPMYRELVQGLVLLKLYPNDRSRLLEARAHIEKALRIEPQFSQARGYLEQVNSLLERPPGRRR